MSVSLIRDDELTEQMTFPYQVSVAQSIRPPSPPVIYQPLTSSSLRIQASFTFNDQERVSEGEGEGESEGERRRDEEKVRKRERVSEGEKKMEGGR